MVVPGAGGWGKQGDVDQCVQSFNQKESKFRGSNVKHSDYNELIVKGLIFNIITTYLKDG